MRKAAWAYLAGVVVLIYFAGRAPAQSTANSAPLATMGQLMKGTLYPESNVVFAAQDDNPADVQRAKDPNMATDLLKSSYGKWEAVENSALAIAEVAPLLSVPGRKCANGVEAPVKNADWEKFVQELRAAGMTAYTAAQAKNQDKMTEVADVMATACKHCHDKYRDRRQAQRCQ
jgi:hypothetical protein